MAIPGGAAFKTGVGIAAIVAGFVFGLALVQKFLPSLTTTSQGNLIAKGTSAL